MNESIRALAESGLSDRAIAEELGLSVMAVQKRRERAGIPTYQRCGRCDDLFDYTGNTGPVCPDCLPGVVARYLATPLPVRQYAKKVGISTDRLARLAIELYGVSRADMTEASRQRVLDVLTESEHDKITS